VNARDKRIGAVDSLNVHRAERAIRFRRDGDISYVLYPER